MKKELERRKTRIAILITLLAITFFAWQWKFRSLEPQTPAQAEPWLTPPPVASQGSGVSLQPLSPGFGLGASTAAPAQKHQGPEPATFPQFVYAGGESILSVADICHDAYYTLLIFPQAKDYRINPEAAVYNSATACERDAVISFELDLSMIKLRPGNYYYFIADQGDLGGWYNPR